MGSVIMQPYVRGVFSNHSLTKKEKESLEKSQKKCEEIKNIFLECLKSNQK